MRKIAGDGNGVDGELSLFSRDMTYPYGSPVIVCRLPMGLDPGVRGNWVHEELPGLAAAESVMLDPDNGLKWSRAILDLRGNLDEFGSSGGGFAAEWSLLPRSDEPDEEDLMGDVRWKS
jgi:hypothetical protein